MTMVDMRDGRCSRSGYNQCTEAIARFWAEVHRRRMWHFKAWARRQGFCNPALTHLATGATPEGVLESCVRTRHVLAPARAVMFVLGVRDYLLMKPPYDWMSERRANQRILLRSPQWRRVAWNTEPTP